MVFPKELIYQVPNYTHKIDQFFTKRFLIHMKYNLNKASCPVCGRHLFRGTPNSIIEGNCPKCGAYLVIRYKENSVCVEALKGQANKPKDN